MRHFYFHVLAGAELLCDDQGQDLPDLAAAQHEAELAGREIIAGAIKAGREDIPEAFLIADELGVQIDIVPIATVWPKP
jgi:hypothetical protein